jgi:hypothetical protein
MSVSALLRAAADQGVELWVEGMRLRFRAPRGTLTPELRDAIALQRAGVVEQLRADAATRTERSPLSFNQRSLWFIHQEAPDSTAYHVGFAVRINSAFDFTALECAVQGVSDRHATLRSTYVLSDDAQLVMESRGAVAVPVRQHDLHGQSDEALHAAVDAAYRQPFSLEHGPVFRCDVFSRSATDHVLLLCAHHIACDGWSLMLVVNELFALYAEHAGQTAARALVRPERTYAEFVSWQADMLSATAGQQLAATWLTALAPPRAVVECHACLSFWARDGGRAACVRTCAGHHAVCRATGDVQSAAVPTDRH